MDHEEQIKQLREQVPVGLRHAALLLEKAGGDVMVARQLFIQEAEAIVFGKTAAPRELVLSLLEQHHYDIPRTLNAIEAELYTVTERILRKIKNNPEAAIGKIALAVEAATPLHRNYWLPLDTMVLPNGSQHSFMVVYEWLSYEDYEGFDIALYFHRELVSTTLRERLSCPGAATAILDGDAAAFSLHRESVIRQLYQLVVSNISQFP
ncbi:hypothetical protein HF324_10520 [Chitinophaga oryzae]|uniref:Uncharacterized protein n=1 Tax=Chitinophaga oryzae TaxID=2725414 RepID=A0AAE6ZGI3_9BACT|nr:hypothetical protein [Chitinophaga oryzae]QJB31792.1 hypothetical protein HF329_10855 [Chitinophaga oryzae]QJB38276.1 hypothetical protein HF324_10520 [Chitinophaga oryzae]